MLLTVKHDGEEVIINKLQSVNLSEGINEIPELKFISVKHRNNPSYEYLENENIVCLGGHEFKIKKATSRKDYKNISAVHIFSDLIGKQKEEEFEDGEYFLEEILEYLFEDTGWTYILKVNPKKRLSGFGVGNVLKLFNDIIKIYSVEFIIRPGMVVEIDKKFSIDREQQFRYGYNVKTLNFDIDTTNLRTKIKAYGKDGLMYEYVSANAVIYGEIEADLLRDETIETEEELEEAAKAALEDVPRISMEIEAAELEKNKELGEVVYLIYEPMGIDITTRILKMQSSLKNDELVPESYTIGNYVFEKVSEKLHKRLIESEEKTKKNIEVKFEILDDRIVSSVRDLDNKLSSQIVQTADQIRSEVQAEVTTINGNITSINNSISTLTQRADMIQSTVTSHTTQISNLGTRMSSAESSITQLADEIDLRVTYDDYTGNKIISRINLTSTTATIQASKINLKGAVTVLSDITDELGTIYAGNIYGVNIYSAYINISDDVRIGNNLYLGSSSSFSVSKRIVFNNYATIRGGGSSADGDGYGIEISASAIELRGYLNVVADATFEQDVEIEGDLIFNGSYQWKANSSGSRVYFKRNGIDLFYIDTNYGEIVPL